MAINVAKAFDLCMVHLYAPPRGAMAESTARLRNLIFGWLEFKVAGCAARRGLALLWFWQIQSYQSVEFF